MKDDCVPWKLVGTTDVSGSKHHTCSPAPGVKVTFKEDKAATPPTSDY
jgi:hypothetical protein